MVRWISIYIHHPAPSPTSKMPGQSTLLLIPRSRWDLAVIRSRSKPNKVGYGRLSRTYPGCGVSMQFHCGTCRRSRICEHRMSRLWWALGRRLAVRHASHFARHHGPARRSRPENSVVTQSDEPFIAVVGWNAPGLNRTELTRIANDVITDIKARGRAELGDNGARLDDYVRMCTRINPLLRLGLRDEPA
jgi:hypothetical protein